MRTRLIQLFAAALLAAFAADTIAQTVKVGVVLPYSGVGAEFAQQVDRGIQTFMKLNPNAFGPYKVDLIKQMVKVGVVLPYSGVGAEFAQQVDRGIQTFMKLNPNAFGPYKVELIK